MNRIEAKPVTGLKYTEIDHVLRAAESIHAAHKERVKTNSKRASKPWIDVLMREVSLKKNIRHHERWLHSFGGNRIFY